MPDQTATEVEKRSPQEIAKSLYISKIQQTLQFSESRAIGEPVDPMDDLKTSSKLQQEIDNQVQKGADLDKVQEEAMEVLRPWVINRAQEALLEEDALYTNNTIEGKPTYIDNLTPEGQKIIRVAKYRKGIAKMAAYGATDEVLNKLVDEFRSQNRPVVIEALKKTISEIEELQKELGLESPSFVKSQLNKQQEDLIHHANNVVTLAQNTYRITPDEVGKERYSTFGLNTLR